MIVSVNEQATLFLTTALIGFALGFVYDWLRILRKIFKHPNIVVQIEDIAYWVFVSGAAFVVLFLKNYASIRFFSVAGFFLGMLIYFITISKLFLSVSMIVVNVIKKIIITLVNIILAPFRLLLKILNYPYQFIKKACMSSYNKSRSFARKTTALGRVKSKKFAKNIKIILKKV